MGSWDFENIGFYNETDPKQVQKFLTCLGVDFTDVHASEAGVIDKRFYSATMGENHTDLSTDKLFKIINEVFGETIFFFEKEEGSNTTDYYYRYEEIYDPKTRKVYINDSNYDYGDELVFFDSPYKLIKFECEAKAKEQDIAIKWTHDESYYLRPEGSKFITLCEEVLDEHGGLSGLGTGQNEANIPDIELSKEDVDKVVTNLKACDCDDLLFLFLMKFGKV